MRSECHAQTDLTRSSSDHVRHHAVNSDSGKHERKDASPAIPIVDSATLMGGRRELIIQHGTGSYRLRITASNKLILTK